MSQVVTIVIITGSGVGMYWYVHVTVVVASSPGHSHVFNVTHIEKYRGDWA